MNDFDQLLVDIEAEAHAEGPAAVAQFDAFNERFRMAAELITARKAEGMTQRQLAAASGVQQAEISRIERGEIEPRETTLARLFAPLGRRLQVAKAASADLQRQAA
jgi:ribosome-binding protein aMBF1 (putative translation factor)